MNGGREAANEVIAASLASGAGNVHAWPSEGQPQRCSCFDLGLQPYVPVWRAMRHETERCVQIRATSRGVSDSASSARLLAGVGVTDVGHQATGRPTPFHQIWQVEHAPVLTLGRNAAPEHVLDAGGVPVVRIDRGGQVTMHLPGQAVVYLLLDLTALGIGVRELVRRIESAMLATLDGWGIAATRREGAPGVYVGADKIGALGLRVTRGRCLHGLSLNVAPALSSMRRMRPCGLEGTANTSMARLGVLASVRDVHAVLLRQLSAELGLDVEPEPGLPAALVLALSRAPGF